MPEKQSQKRRSRLIEIAVAVGLVALLAIAMPLVLSDFRLKLLGRFLSLAIVA